MHSLSQRLFGEPDTKRYHKGDRTWRRNGTRNGGKTVAKTGTKTGAETGPEAGPERDPKWGQNGINWEHSGPRFAVIAGPVLGPL